MAGAPQLGAIVRSDRLDIKQAWCNEQLAVQAVKGSNRTMMQFRLPIRWRDAALAVATATLCACASLPSGKSGRTSGTEQPLARIKLAPTPPEHDALQSLLAGQFALAAGDLPAAAREFSQAARLDDDPALAAQATRVALVAKQWDLARDDLARWQALRGEDPDIWQSRAMLALHDGKSDAAYADLSRLAKEPNGKGWGALAQVLIGAEDHDAAGALLERLVKPELLGDKVQTWIAISQLASRLERPALAQSLATQAVARFKNAEAYAWAAQLKLKSGDKAGARTLFADALKHNPKDAHLRIAYAALLGELGDNVEAAHTLAVGLQDDYTLAARAAYLARADDKPMIEALYREAKALPEPRSPDRLNLLGQLAELLERKPEALNWYAKVPADSEHAFGAQLRTTVLLDETGKSAEAMSMVHDLQARAADDSKELGETYLLEAEMLNHHQRGEEAVAVYDRGLQTLPDDTRLLYARALLNDDLDHVDAAVRDLRRVLELKPDDANAMNALGYTLADRTDHQAEALDLIKKALTLKPDEPAIMDSLGWVQFRLGHIDAALTQLRTAYEKQPDAEIAAHLGEVLWASGQRDEARRVWDQGRKKDGKNKVLLETIQRLTS
jgi:tetratricopeptide (TPR) repeat protein